MNPKQYFSNLDIEQKEGFARRANTSVKYMKSHLFKASTEYPSRYLGAEPIVNIANGSEGNISLDEAIDYFLVQPIKKLAKEMEAEKIPSQSSAASLPSANAEVPV